MRSGLIGFALAASIGIFHHAQPVYIPTSCMDHIKFTKPCPEVSGSLCIADPVEVTFHCVDVKKEVGKVKVIE
jgi:hypothetical protein